MRQQYRARRLRRVRRGRVRGANAILAASVRSVSEEALRSPVAPEASPLSSAGVPASFVLLVHGPTNTELRFATISAHQVRSARSQEETVLPPAHYAPRGLIVKSMAQSPACLVLPGAPAILLAQRLAPAAPVAVRMSMPQWDLVLVRYALQAPRRTRHSQFALQKRMSVLMDTRRSFPLLHLHRSLTVAF
jgi:hypothetical protein